jgi:Skp family chaperone for outer membrane proteins
LKTRFLLIFLLIFFSSSVFSTDVRVLNFQKIIDNSTSMILLYEQINKDQENHKLKFRNEELKLNNELKRIKELNLILDPAELEKEIENYNNKLNNFNNKIEKFNSHYEFQINNLKNNLVNIILDILKKYSEDKKIDLILDSNNYILSTNSIDITDTIKDQLNKKAIGINFEKY